jgi:hypothetical protein
MHPYHYSHICFQTIVLHGFNFANGYDINTLADELFLHILWTDEACFTREGVFNVHNSHLWAQDNPHAIRERGYQVRFSVSVWAGIVGDILTAQRYCDFLETVLLGAA